MVDRYTIGRLSLYALYGGPATVFGHLGSPEEEGLNPPRSTKRVLDSDNFGRLVDVPLPSGFPVPFLVVRLFPFPFLDIVCLRKVVLPFVFFKQPIYKANTSCGIA
jgi:hypothetical protein